MDFPILNLWYNSPNTPNNQINLSFKIAKLNLRFIYPVEFGKAGMRKHNSTGVSQGQSLRQRTENPNFLL